jgi:hypothetical protein
VLLLALPGSRQLGGRNSGLDRAVGVGLVWP